MKSLGLFTFFATLVGFAVDWGDFQRFFQKKFSASYFEVCPLDGKVKGIISSRQVKFDEYLVFNFGGNTLSPAATGDNLKKVMNDGFSVLPLCGTHQQVRLEDSEMYFRINSKGKLVVTANIYNEDDCLVAVIKDNNVNIEDRCKYSFNSDGKSIELVEIKDNEINTILLIDYNCLNTVTVRGRFGTKSMFYNISKDAYHDISKRDMATKVLRLDTTYTKKVKPVFEYIGPDSAGKRLDPNGIKCATSITVFHSSLFWILSALGIFSIIWGYLYMKRKARTF